MWTNFIYNAVNAMDGAGPVQISTRLAGDDVVVEIGDTGRGMAPQAAARSFEAFYTTRKWGQEHRSRPRYRPTHRRGAPRWHDHRLPTGETVLPVRIPSERRSLRAQRADARRGATLDGTQWYTGGTLAR